MTEHSFKYKALSLRDIGKDGVIESDGIQDYYSLELLKNEYFTRPGDILIRLSSPYTPILISESDKDLLVSSHFAIVRTKKDIDSNFLYWWFNQNKKQFYIFASGSSLLGTISSGYIADMRFNPPPLTKQKQIGQLIQLANKEQELFMRLAEKRKDIINQQLINLVN
jgi:restriction endonuclease S subunit